MKSSTNSQSIPPDALSGGIAVAEGSGTINYRKFGRLVIINIVNYHPVSAGVRKIATLPFTPTMYSYNAILETTTNQARLLAAEGTALNLTVVANDSNYIGSVSYLTNQ